MLGSILAREGALISMNARVRDWTKSRSSTAQLSSVLSGSLCLACFPATHLTHNSYLVVPNPATGLLHWAKNGDPVDTAPGRWQDSGDGSGIIPLQKDGEAHEGEGLQDDRSTISSGSSAWTSFDSPSSSDDGLNPEEAQRRRDDAHHYAHYMVDSEDKKSHKAHKFTTHGLMDRLLRKTVGKNTWIYVSSELIRKWSTFDVNAGL